MGWAAVLISAAGCLACRLAGMSIPKQFLERPFLQQAAALMPAALLSALIALQTLTSGRHLVVDARLAGVAVAAVAIRVGAPFLEVVVLAAAVTALLRALA